MSRVYKYPGILGVRAGAEDGRYAQAGVELRVVSSLGSPSILYHFESSAAGVNSVVRQTDACLPLERSSVEIPSREIHAGNEMCVLECSGGGEGVRTRRRSDEEKQPRGQSDGTHPQLIASVQAASVNWSYECGTEVQIASKRGI